MLGLFGSALAQKPPAKCGPDHAILYKRAVKLLDNAEKKLTAGYTAEAKSQAKEANSLFTILQKECGPQQAERALTDQEIQQEAINQKLAADELAQAERLTKSAEEKQQKAVKLETTQPDVYLKLPAGSQGRIRTGPQALHQSGNLRPAQPADGLQFFGQVICWPGRFERLTRCVSISRRQPPAPSG